MCFFFVNVQAEEEDKKKNTLFYKLCNSIETKSNWRDWFEALDLFRELKYWNGETNDEEIVKEKKTSKFCVNSFDFDFFFPFFVKIIVQVSVAIGDKKKISGFRLQTMKVFSDSEKNLLIVGVAYATTVQIAFVFIILSQWNRKSESTKCEQN